MGDRLSERDRNIGRLETETRRLSCLCPQQDIEQLRVDGNQTIDLNCRQFNVAQQGLHLHVRTFGAIQRANMNTPLPDALRGSTLP